MNDELNLDDFRVGIDRIDDQIVNLLGERKKVLCGAPTLV